MSWGSWYRQTCWDGMKISELKEELGKRKIAIPPQTVLALQGWATNAIPPEPVSDSPEVYKQKLIDLLIQNGHYTLDSDVHICMGWCWCWYE